VENIESNKLINRIQKNIIDKKITLEELINDLKMVRQFALQEKNPTLTKVLRLTYEHLEEYEGFNIAIPSDEQIDELDGEEVSVENEIEDSQAKGVESLIYLLSLMMNSKNKTNITEIKEYRDALMEFAENN